MRRGGYSVVMADVGQDPQSPKSQAVQKNSYDVEEISEYEGSSDESTVNKK